MFIYLFSLNELMHNGFIIRRPSWVTLYEFCSVLNVKIIDETFWDFAGFYLFLGVKIGNYLFFQNIFHSANDNKSPSSSLITHCQFTNDFAISVCDFSLLARRFKRVRAWCLRRIVSLIITAAISADSVYVYKHKKNTDTYNI